MQTESGSNNSNNMGFTIYKQDNSKDQMTKNKAEETTLKFCHSTQIILRFSHFLRSFFHMHKQKTTSSSIVRLTKTSSLGNTCRTTVSFDRSSSAGMESSVTAELLD